MPFLTVDDTTCNRDGICAAVCPAGVIRGGAGALPEPVDDAAVQCIRCGHCVAACPTRSLSLEKMPVERCPESDPAGVVSAEGFRRFLLNRRSIRAYRDEAVPRETIERLLDVARYAPSGHNCQCVEWLIFDDPDKLRALAAGTVDWMRWMIGHDPATAEAMHLARVVSAWDDGHDGVLRGAPALVIAHAAKDNRLAPAACTIAVAHLELLASAEGLGACWAGFFNFAATVFPPLRALLPIPDGHLPLGSLMLGYPKFRYRRTPERRPLRVIWAE